MDSNNLQEGEVVITEVGIQWASLVPHIILSFVTCGAWIIILIYVAICRSKTKLTLTNRRLIGKVGGLFSSDFLDLPLNKVSSVMIVNSLFGKILGYATVAVASSSGGYNYDYVKGGSEFRNAVNAQIEIFEENRIKKQAMEIVSATK